MPVECRRWGQPEIGAPRACGEAQRRTAGTQPASLAGWRPWPYWVDTGRPPPSSYRGSGAAGGRHGAARPPLSGARPRGLPARQPRAPPRRALASPSPSLSRAATSTTSKLEGQAHQTRPAGGAVFRPRRIILPVVEGARSRSLANARHYAPRPSGNGADSEHNAVRRVFLGRAVQARQRPPLMRPSHVTVQGHLSHIKPLESTIMASSRGPGCNPSKLRSVLWARASLVTRWNVIEERLIQTQSETKPQWGCPYG